MKRMRLFIGLAALAFVLVTAGCGSGSNPGDTPAAIPSSVASDLAAQSESIADALDAGDECGAAHQADDLRHAADEAIAGGSIPAAYRSDLETAVTNLQTIVNCPPPDKNNQGHEDEGHGPAKPKGHDKHDGPPSVTSTGTTAGTTTGEAD
jgi:hypothetical protein